MNVYLGISLVLSLSLGQFVKLCNFTTKRISEKVPGYQTVFAITDNAIHFTYILTPILTTFAQYTLTLYICNIHIHNTFVKVRSYLLHASNSS